MFSSIDRTPSTFPLLSPTVIDLEEQQYEQAKALSESLPKALSEDKGDAEVNQWKNYLNLLGQQAFQSWFSEQRVDTQPPSESLTFSDHEIRLAHLGEFRLFLFVVEQCLSEEVSIPTNVIDDPDKAAHFYILLEVAEEQSEVWLRGLIRHDQLYQMQQTQSIQSQADANEDDTITLPLSAFEPEPSRLLHYCRYLTPDAIPLPQIVSNPTSPAALLSTTVATVRTRLSEWLGTSTAQGWQSGWQSWDLLQPQLAYATRGLSDGLKRGKLVNLELGVGTITVALVLTLLPEADEKISILVQLLPAGSERTLPPQIMLSLVSKKGKSLQTVTSRNQDNYIQLKSFKGTVGQRFSLQIQYQGATVSEDFEI
ncbi:MAG: DUF1822 family protein [Phormidesmis sp.]